MPNKKKSEREQERIEQAEMVRRMREDGFRPVDLEVDDAQASYWIEFKRKSRQAATPLLRERPVCEVHNWPSERRPGVPPPPRSECPGCKAAQDAKANPPRSTPVVVDTPRTRTTAEWERLSAKLADEREQLDPEPERGTWQHEDWLWRRHDPGLSSMSVEAAKEAQALARIDELRDEEIAEKNRKPGGRVAVYAPVFAGGADSAESRTLYKRRVVRDSGITVI